MGQKPRMLYLMHVSWGWIKQRPHFLAEKLSKWFDIDVYAITGLRDNKDTQLNRSGKNSFGLHKLFLPGHKRKNIRNSDFFKWFYQFILNIQTRGIASYKYIWVTNLIFYKYIEKYISSDQIIIYDCMDDDMEFPSNKNDKERLELFKTLEKKLLDRADLVIFSATYLKNKVASRTNFDTAKSIIINNAVELLKKSDTDHPDVAKISNIINKIKGTACSVTYIGTISSWFDFGLILKSIQYNPDIHYFLFGPTEVEIPDSPNIHYLGSVEHKYIFEIMNASSALIMPFVVNELIRSVNPVKLYEYINSGKPAIAPRYEETEQFSDYTFLYSNESEYLELCRLLIDGSLCQTKSKKEINSFINNNTWGERVSKIITALRFSE